MDDYATCSSTTTAGAAACGAVAARPAPCGTPTVVEGAPCCDAVGAVVPCCIPAAGVSAFGFAGALLSDVVSTWRSTINAALRSGVEAEDESDPEASEASRNRPEFWNACLISSPVRP